MKYEPFVGEVQNRLQLPDQGRAVRAIRATLTTLGERLQPDEAGHLAAELPMEIDRFLTEAQGGQRFDFRELVNRRSEREGVDPPDANYHAKQILQLVSEVVSSGEMQDVMQQLPDEFDDLFELVGATTNQ